MRRLNVTKFSCIESASLDFGRVTILIGPQASGKSVLCKLSYFFIDILHEQWKFTSIGNPIELYKEYIKAKFVEWFPVSAWGDKKFCIDFSSGDYKISLTRQVYRGEVGENFRIRVSPELEKQYAETLTQVTKYLSKTKRNPDYSFEADWEMRNASIKAIEKMLGKDHLAYQLFIPAGRSFFTSMGKAVAAFEQGRVLDPLILRFGRLFTAYKDQRHYSFYDSEKEKSHVLSLKESLSKILGGSLIVKGDKELVESTDGRQIPLSALSSGQQELLPLVAVLPHLVSRSRRQNLYVEEPEAHLFPTAQSTLVEIFANLLNLSGASLDLVLTTHSPYVLVKINNLLKAGQLGRSQSESKRVKVQSIIPRQAWLARNTVSAYAIKDGVLENIVDDDGLINADYLDEVSSEISKEFMRLLEVEITE